MIVNDTNEFDLSNIKKVAYEQFLYSTGLIKKTKFKLHKTRIQKIDEIIKGDKN